MTSRPIVACPTRPSIPLPPTYRKKTISRNFPKELYLRSDLPCHTLLCDDESCRAFASTNAPSGLTVERVGVLDPHASHYVLPSYHALERFHEVFTRSSQHVILLRAHALQWSKGLERKCMEYLEDRASERKVVFFENEHHVATATKQRVSGETIQERHARAERRTAKWYVKHLKGRKPIVLVEEFSAEEDEQQQMEGRQYPRMSGGVMIHSMKSYLHWLKDQPTAATSEQTKSKRADASEDSSTPEQLLDLYSQLLELESAKRRARVAQALAAEQLERMLHSLKLDWTRHTSEGESKDQDEDRMDETTAVVPSTTSSMIPPGTTTGEAEYEEHIPLSLALDAVKAGLLMRGHLRVNKHHASVDASIDLGGRKIDVATGALLGASSDSVVASSLSSTTTSSIFISGQIDRNRAIDGDECIVQLLPQPLWKAPTQRKLLKGESGAGATAGATDGSGEREEEEAELLSSQAASEQTIPTGRVVAIVKRNIRPYVATLQLESAGGDYSLVVPMNPVIPKIRIRTHQVRELADQRLLVQIDTWPVDSKYPAGIYVKSLGPINELETGVRCILMEGDISHPPFSVNMLKSLPYRPESEEHRNRKYKVGSGFHSRGKIATPFDWTVPPQALVGRRDLRESHRDCVCSIDPIGCEDIDDALSCRILSGREGHVEIGVHIADVSYFVPTGSLLDQEASRRGTSVYLVDRRLDMLPSVLSSDLCSLRGGTERLCISVLWTFDRETGKVLSTWYGRTVIYNSFALSYEEAQLIYDTQGGTKPLPASLPKDHSDYYLSQKERYSTALESSLTQEERKKLYPQVTLLLTLARGLRQKRLEVGALELDSLSIKFRLSDSKEILGVEEEPDLEVHSTIAEWMVFANSTIAYAIYQCFPQAALLRHHPYPAPARFEKLKELAGILGLELNIESNKALAESLTKAEEIIRSRETSSASNNAAIKSLLPSGEKVLDSTQSSTWIMKLLRETAARAMSEAQYISSGSVAHVKEFFHYGLSADFYTHFTSPIRRYADLIVHRQILEVIQLERKQFKEQKLQQKLLEGKSAGVGNDALVSTSSNTASTPLFTNETLSSLASHLNVKNRNAKLAGMASEELFLASYLSSAPGEPPKVERVEGLIVGLRKNGFIILLPKYHVKGAVLLQDRQGFAKLAHPLDLAFPLPANVSDENDESPSRPKLKSKIELNEATQELTFTLSMPLDAPIGAPKDVISPLPLSHTFHVFDPCVVDISLRPNLSRYRIPKPTFKLVWHQREVESARTKRNIQAGASEQRESSAEVSYPSASSSSDPSPFTSAPAAPAGAKKQRLIGQAMMHSSTLYEIMRAAATMSVPLKKREKKDKKTDQMSVGERKLQNLHGPRVRVRHSGAFNGRLLFTPGGTIPTEMLRSTITQQGGGGGDEGYEEEEY